MIMIDTSVMMESEEKEANSSFIYWIFLFPPPAQASHKTIIPNIDTSNDMYFIPDDGGKN